MLLVVMIVAMMAFIFIGSQMIQNSASNSKFQLNVTVQADNVARAGLTDAINWFRNQVTQPVRSTANPALYPYPDAAFAPIASSGDTIDTNCTSPSWSGCTGLVKEYPIGENSSLTAHYEVLRQNDPSSNPVNSDAVHDITGERISGHVAGEGLAWYVECIGTVYEQLDPSRAYNVAPNRIVGTSKVATEIRRVALTLPANAAVIINNRHLATIQTNGRIAGGTGNIGLGYFTGSSGPNISGSGAQCTGTYPTANITTSSTTAVNFQQIFGLNPQDMKLMADIDVNGTSAMPANYPAMAIVYFEQSATFPVSNPLQGGGILYVNGDLTLSSGSQPLFSGVIYVNGNVTITGDSLISGALIVTGSLTLNGTSGGVAQVQYDNTIINSVRQQVGIYRENKAAFYTFSATQ